MRKDTIAFISAYDHPSRDSFESAIRRSFPEYRVETISVMDVVKRNMRWAVWNLAFCAKEYGGSILRGLRDLRTSYLQTSYLFSAVHEEMASIIDPERHLFSLQIQSMYDCSAPGVPHFVYTDHTHLSNLASEYFDRRMLRPSRWISLERDLYHNAACVFTRSSNITDDLRHLYDMPVDRVECVLAGANALIDHDLPLNNDDYGNRNILFVGTDWERKGGPQLVEAFRKVLRVCPKAQLTIVGTNPGLYNVPNCRVIGPVPTNEIHRHYSQASVFCLPTRLEPFGIAFLEAMLHRLPVIGTRVDAVPDLVEDSVTGLLVRPDAPSELADALIGLLADPQRCRRYGEAGYERARGRYTWDAVGQRIRARVLKELAARRRVSSCNAL
jgi:glycosyltransferase involved in cell wall biosynthesis